MKITITRSKTEKVKNSGTIKIADLTQGEMLALLNALAVRSIDSHVCNDVFQNVHEAMQTAWPIVASDAIDPETLTGD